MDVRRPLISLIEASLVRCDPCAIERSEDDTNVFSSFSKGEIRKSTFAYRDLPGNRKRLGRNLHL
jgi:hypothetical protein